MAKHKRKTSPKGPDTQEIATILGGRDITQGYVDNLELLPSTDTVLQARGAGNLKIYEEVLRDEEVAADLSQRRLGVTSREWEVLPGGDKRRDKQAAESLAAQLKSIRFDEITAKMLYGVYWGYSAGECLWARDGTEVILDAVKVRNPKRFGFAPDGSLKLLTTTHPNGEALPPRKFWRFSTGHWHDDDPHGLGLAHWLYWPTLFKRRGIKFWLIFIEKFAAPTVMGTYPRNTELEKQTKLLTACKAVQTDASVILPEGMAIELIEAARAGTVDYKGLLDTMNAAIAKVILGQTLTSSAQNTGLGSNLGDVHMEVRQDIVKADADLICHSFNVGPARWLTDWNYPGAAYPQVWRRLVDEPDLKPQAERDKLIFDMGFKPTLDYIHEAYNGEWTEAPPPAQPDNAQLQPGDAVSPPQFAEQPAPADAKPSALAGLGTDAADDFADQLERESAQVLDELMQPVVDLMEGSADLAEFRDGLLKLYPDMDTAELGSLIHRAQVNADLAGRSEVSDGE